MKTLYLLRHAKSSWDDPGLSDHDRPLAPRGRQAAARMGAYFRQQGLSPKRVLVSSATRTRQTWGLLAPRVKSGAEAEIRRDIYDADAEDLMAMAASTPDGLESVLIVAHNPALEELAMRLAGDGDDEAVREMRRKYPTGALAELMFDVSAWSDVAPGSGFLVRFVRPKSLPE